jgi:hypothetical protein
MHHLAQPAGLPHQRRSQVAGLQAGRCRPATAVRSRAYRPAHRRAAQSTQLRLDAGSAASARGHGSVEFREAEKDCRTECRRQAEARRRAGSGPPLGRQAHASAAQSRPEVSAVRHSSAGTAAVLAGEAERDRRAASSTPRAVRRYDDAEWEVPRAPGDARGRLSPARRRAWTGRRLQRPSRATPQQRGPDDGVRDGVGARRSDHGEGEDAEAEGQRAAVKRQLELNPGDNWLPTVFLRILLRPWG